METPNIPPQQPGGFPQPFPGPMDDFIPPTEEMARFSKMMDGWGAGPFDPTAPQLPGIQDNFTVQLPESSVPTLQKPGTAPDVPMPGITPEKTMIEDPLFREWLMQEELKHDIAMSALMDQLEASIETIGREREAELTAQPDWPKVAPEHDDAPPEQIVFGPYGPTGIAPPPPGLVDPPARNRPHVEPPLPSKRGGGGGGKPRITTFRPKIPNFAGRNRQSFTMPQCQGEEGCSACNRSNNCPFKTKHEERENQ
jgi:hypothetical protein